MTLTISVTSTDTLLPQLVAVYAAAQGWPATIASFDDKGNKTVVPNPEDPTPYAQKKLYEHLMGTIQGYQLSQAHQIATASVAEVAASNASQVDMKVTVS